VVEHAARTAASLHDPAVFYDPNRLDSARETIATAARLHSLANGRVEYNITPIGYRVSGVDIGTLADLDRATADRELDLFADLHDRVLADLDATVPTSSASPSSTTTRSCPGCGCADCYGPRSLRGHRRHAPCQVPDELAVRPRFFELFADGVIAYEGETALAALVEEVGPPRMPDAARGSPVCPTCSATTRSSNASPSAPRTWRTSPSSPRRASTGSPSTVT